jgi:signal transduction histidine kinase
VVNDPAVFTPALLARAKERLYVFCQLAGWLAFLALQLLFTRLFRSPTGGTGGAAYAAIVQVVLFGLLITHYSRRWIHRWGWKELGWRQLTPRVAAMAAVQSLAWSLIGYGFYYGVLRMPWDSKYSLLLVMGTSWVNGFGLLVGWHCLYFVYHLFERLNRLEVEGLRLAAAAKEAELRALKSQVNPHFLFNSLNSLRALIDEDPPRAREAVTRMANLLRYSLQSGQLETVTLDDELRTVEDYLALEQIRHENRLRVRWDLTEEARCRALPVPPMLLQTLVENAVKYGISPRREGGELTISARCDGAALRIRVTNPGELAASAGASTGLGLRNAADRLKMLFGDRATLELRAEGPGRVAADISIPLPPDGGRS